jgi:AraC-like DNA-binding protein
MGAATPLPSPVLQARYFSDVDEFKKAARKFNVDFTPLVRKIAVQQTILNLAEFDIISVKSFPRLADTQLADNCTAIVFTMDESGDQVRFNGVEVDRPVIGIGHGGNGFTVTERIGAQLAAINFTPEILDRGWPETRQHFSIFETTVLDQQRLRLIVSEVLKFATTSPDMVLLPQTMTALKESLLAGVDTIFANNDTSKPRRSLHSTRAFAIFQRIEAHLREDLKSPIYSNALAEAVGVSIRTLQDVILQYRSMSLHRYLRIKRLWLVRKRLMAGRTSVKACALEYGFWHLSDFSRSYHLHFGETPSQTLARAR